MSTKFIALLFAACTSIAVVPSAHATLIVGNNDTGNCYPFACNDSGTAVGQSIEYQQIYSSSAFSGAINIGSLSYYNDAADSPGGATVLHGNYSIYLSTTSVAVGSMDSTLANNIGADNMLFYSGDLGGNALDFTIDAIAPFFYDPSLGNLLIDIVVTDQENVANGSGNGYNETDDTGTVTQRSYALANDVSGTNESSALVTGFDAATVPEPGTLSLLAASLFGLAATRRRQRNSLRRESDVLRLGGDEVCGAVDQCGSD